MKRKWFQIHLSTAVLVMVTASALLFANVAKKKWLVLTDEEKMLQPVEDSRIIDRYVRGFPCNWQTLTTRTEGSDDTVKRSELDVETNWRALANDVLFSFFIIAVIGSASEIYIQKQVSRRTCLPQSQ